MGDPGPSDDAAKRTGVRVGVGLVAIGAVALVAWLAFSGDDSAPDSSRSQVANATSKPARGSTGSAGRSSTSNSTGSEIVTTAPEIVTVDSLRKTAEKQKTPIYWAGERPGTRLALSPLSPQSQGRTFVRYLTAGARADDFNPDFLTVITYLFDNPAAIQRAQAEGNPISKTPSGARIYYDHSQPESIFLVYPGVDAEIEIFAPTDFKQALQLVNSGGIVPVA
jgi:hypothetical protein